MTAAPEWLPGTLANVKAGDTIRLEHGDGSVLVRTVRITDINNLYVNLLFGCASSIERLLSEGWSLFVQAAPKSVLPIEPGIYEDRDGDLWRLKVDGEWRFLDSAGDVLNAADYAPFTRLAPVADTAKRVLARLLDEDLPDFAEIAADFGVTK